MGSVVLLMIVRDMDVDSISFSLFGGVMRMLGLREIWRGSQVRGGNLPFFLAGSSFLKETVTGEKRWVSGFSQNSGSLVPTFWSPCFWLSARTLLFPPGETYQMM